VYYLFLTLRCGHHLCHHHYRQAYYLVYYQIHILHRHHHRSMLLLKILNYFLYFLLKHNLGENFLDLPLHQLLLEKLSL
tara:strand:- start:63 stop:299 length:237 start_codon:yes stop_codon:yes gene_type:complete